MLELALANSLEESKHGDANIQHVHKLLEHITMFRMFSMLSKRKIEGNLWS